MHQQPRATNQPVFSSRDILVSSIAGTIVCVTLISTAIFLKLQGYAPDFIRSVIFVNIILSNLGLIIAFLGLSIKKVKSVNTWYREPLAWIAVGVVALCGIIFASESMRNLFGLAAPSLALVTTGFLTSALGLSADLIWRTFYLQKILGPPEPAIQTGADPTRKENPKPSLYSKLRNYHA